MHFTFEIETVGGLAAPGFVDALADVVYADARLVDATIAVNRDGSLALSFEVEADDAGAASTTALESFSTASGTAAARYDSDRALAAAQAAIRQAASRPAASVASMHLDRAGGVPAARGRVFESSEEFLASLDE